MAATAVKKIKTSVHIDEALWTALEVRAAQRQLSKGGALEQAVSAYLGVEPDEPARPKALRDAHALLDILHENIERGHYSAYWAAITRLLAIVRDDLGEK